MGEEFITVKMRRKDHSAMKVLQSRLMAKRKEDISITNAISFMMPFIDEITKFMTAVEFYNHEDMEDDAKRLCIEKRIKKLDNSVDEWIDKEVK